jgi:hypothetical protein
MGGPLPGQTRERGQAPERRTRFANRTLCAALVESARGAVRKRDCYLAAQYRRLSSAAGTGRPWSRWPTASW